MSRPIAPAQKYKDMTAAKADEVKRRYFGKREKQEFIAKEMGMSQASVSRIVSGISWSQA